MYKDAVVEEWVTQEFIISLMPRPCQWQLSGDLPCSPSTTSCPQLEKQALDETQIRYYLALLGVEFSG